MERSDVFAAVGVFFAAAGMQGDCCMAMAGLIGSRILLSMPSVQGCRLFAHPHVAHHQKTRESRAVLRAYEGLQCVLVQHAMAAALQLRVLFCVCMPGCRPFWSRRRLACGSVAGLYQGQHCYFEGLRPIPP